MSLLKSNKRVSAPDIAFQNRSTMTRYNGHSAYRVAQAVFDSAGLDSAGAANSAIGAHGTGVYLPDNAIITRVWIDVVTTFASTAGGTDLATIAVSIQAANDVVSAISIATAGDVWDAGIRGSLIGFPNFGADAAHDSAIEVGALFAASMLKLTAERQITVTVATAALTAGKMVIYVEYALGD